MSTDNSGKHDPVNNPSHYASGGVECIDAIKASMSQEAYLGYLKGNVQKYLWRYEKKANPVEDLRKAQWYLARLVEEQEAPQPQMSEADRQAWLADVVAAGEAEMTKARNALREKLRAPRK